MDYDQELRRLRTIFNDKEAYRELLDQRGTLAQSLLDLLQLLIDAPDITTTLRTSICTTMLRLSKASDLYPSCMTIQNLNTMGNHPVAGGGFGDIWKGVLGGDSGRVVCLKVVKMYIMSDVKRLLKDFLREAIVWRQLIHPNVLPCLGLYYLDNKQERMCLVSPWMENGNLAHYLQNTPCDSVKQLQLMHDIASGISYLHALKIVHGDLKGLNILITPAHRACIADFGLSRVADSQLFKITSSSSHAAGTARWSAPEIHMGSTATKESDIYSYGCVCYEIVTGLRPFHHLANEAAVAFAVWRGDRPSRPANVEIQNELWSLINRCWGGEPSSRPNIVDVLHSLVDLHPSGATIPLAEGWDNALFTELRNNIERSDRQPQMLTDFLTTLEVKCKHIPEGPADMGALVESLPEDRTVATTPMDGHAPDEESKLDNDIRKLKKLCRKLMDLADGRLAFRNFVEGDIALFLQTRKPMGNWATFNVSSPHYFLQAPENVKEQLKAREWFVARITSITERVVVRDDPTSTNPYGLDNGTKYFLLQADLDWSKPTPELLRSREALKTGNWTRHELVKQGRMYREQARQKIEFNKFSEGDLALFLPTRNTITGAWAPFKISFFHIYLSPSGELAGQIRTREWILGYITSITERVVDSEDPTSNPFALIGNGLKYYTVDAKEWAKAGDHSQSRSKKQKPVQDIPPSPSSEEDDIVIVSPADYSDITEVT